MAKSSGLRFLIAGTANTVLTYILYLSLLDIAGHQVSYAISFTAGILISYILGRIFVFKKHQGYRSAIMLPFVYILQYAVGATMLWILVDILHKSPTLAPAVSILVTLPITYILSKLVFVGKL